MSRSQVETKHYFITRFGCVTTFHVLWCIALFHVAWECDCVVQNFCWGWGSYLQRGRNSNEGCFSRIQCGMFSCTFCYLPTGPPPSFSPPPPPSLEPAVVTYSPPHLLPQPHLGNMEPAVYPDCWVQEFRLRLRVVQPYYVVMLFTISQGIPTMVALCGESEENWLHTDCTHLYICTEIYQLYSIDTGSQGFREF